MDHFADAFEKSGLRSRKKIKKESQKREPKDRPNIGWLFYRDYFKDEDFEDITDTKESKIVEDYMPNLKDLLMQSLNEKFIIIDNRLLGGKLFEQYLNLIIYKAISPNTKLPIKKAKDRNNLISLY